MANFLSNIASAAGAIASGINTARSIGSALSNLSNPNKLLSAVRTKNLPAGGEGPASGQKAQAQFRGAFNEDWRAKLTLIDKSFFDNSPVLEPIKQAGYSLIFPYTPSINIGHSAKYAPQQMTHQNYAFLTYQNSQVSEIQVVGDFAVEDAEQGAYWIAVIHFLRSVTKMYTGTKGDAYPGNPPPILNFSAYGDFVFKNVPVVVTSFNVNLPKEVDYIGVNVGYNPSIEQSAQLQSGAVSAANQTNTATTTPNQNKAQTPKIGENHVPTNSSITVSLTPIYSREQVRNFSLTTFVQGGYVGKGYL
jgi:hypothetical protein